MSSIQNTYLASTLFGNKSTANNGSIFSASNFMDLSLMKNGVYTKMLRSYYDKTGTDATKETGTKTTSTASDITAKFAEAAKVTTSSSVSSSLTNLSNVKAYSGALEKSSSAVESLKVDTATDEEISKAVSSMVDDYNSLITAATDSEDTGIAQIGKWMKNDISARKSQLSDIGITVGSDGKLSLDKDVLSAASKNDIDSFLTGSDGLASRINTRAEGMEKYAQNRISYESGSSLYSSSGLLG